MKHITSENFKFFLKITFDSAKIRKVKNYQEQDDYEITIAIYGNNFIQKR